MKNLICSSLLVFSVLWIVSGCSQRKTSSKADSTPEAATPAEQVNASLAPQAGSVYDFTMDNIDGKPVPLKQYEGKVLLIVNVASKCGFTPQYEDLQKLYEMYEEQGLVVLGFPANNFMNQEPGSNAEIKQFCSTKYQVTFPMFSKISVKGKDMHPLYAWLTTSLDEKVGWNFNKFLIGPDGKPIAHFGSRVNPMDDKLRAAIDNALGA